MCYWILTSKVMVIASTMVQHVTLDEVTTDDCQRRITESHEKLDIRLVQDNPYSVDLDGVDDFVSNDVLNLFEFK